MGRDRLGARTPPDIDVLAISGGSDFGTFWTSILIGWRETADPALRPPDFEAVTGISTGAPIAPFAFTGTDGSYKAVDEFVFGVVGRIRRSEQCPQCALPSENAA